jgi:protein-S-isoprenylcysteine O-methyltransferase Ste14
MKYEKTLNVLSMAAVVIGFIYSIFLPVDYYSIWFFLGFPLFTIGLFIYLSVFLTVRNINTDKPFTKGPYRFSRHPIYLGNFLIIISVLIMTLSLIFLIFFVIVTIHLFLAMPAEERFCLEKYGQDYREYLKKTPRLIGIPKEKDKI